MGVDSVAISKWLMCSTSAMGARIIRVILFSVAELLVNVRLLDPRPIRREWRLIRWPCSPEVHHCRLHLLRRLKQELLLIICSYATIINIDKVAILSSVLVKDFIIISALLEEVLRVLIIDQVLKVVLGVAPGQHLLLRLRQVVIIMVIRVKEAVFFHD